MADLQSAAINRSATCAQPSGIPVPHPSRAPFAAWVGDHISQPNKLQLRFTCFRALRLYGDSPELSEHAPQWNHRGGLIRRSACCAEIEKLAAVRLPASASKWSWRRDLNPRPSDYKSDALPAELRQPDHPKMLPGNTGKSADTLPLRA